MKVASVTGVNSLRVTRANNSQKIEMSQPSHIQFQISFTGNPDKNPKQISAYATESNYLGGIYKAGGLGDVAEALPDSISRHCQDVDIRTFLPYYSFDNSDGKLYVASKETVEKIKNGENVYYKKDGKQADFKFENVDYKLKDGESFVLITESKDGSKVDRLFLLDDLDIQGNVERVKLKGLDMESIPYRVFKAQTPNRKDQTYLIYTPEMASGKTAYGIYQKYNKNSSGTTAYGSSSNGTTAYGASSSAGQNGIEQAISENNFRLSGSSAGDMFFTEQIRAMEKATEKMAERKTDKFNPQSILLHDRFAYVYISDAYQKAKEGNRHYQGLRFVPIFHNPGRDKQGIYSNPVDYFRVVATKSDVEKLKADPNYDEIVQIADRIEKGEAGFLDSARIYNFFKGYFPNLIDSEGTFNMTMIPIAATEAQPDNCIPGNVSKFYGLETRSLPDIAQGITDELGRIEPYTVDVVNGAKPANMATDKQDGFFGSGTLNSIFKDTNDKRCYTPFKATDTPETIFDAKKSNKINLINILADATKSVDNGDKDAIAKVFFNDNKMKGIRAQAKDTNLDLTLGGFSEYQEGDILMTSWGRPDPQKGLVTTLAAFKDTLLDENIPLEVRKHLKLIMGAGGGNDAFSGTNSEWINIKRLMKEISEIEVDGQKGIFKNNALYINGLFPNRIANCADLAIFTSRWEPCGITPFESFATGTPVLSIKTGGAPDFITEGKNGFLTKSAFMLSADVLNVRPNASYDELDIARINHSAKQISDSLREKYLEPFINDNDFNKNYSEYKKRQLVFIENCLEQKIEWHNNSAYNKGKSALELYTKDKCRTQDNDVNDTPVSSLRGDFDDSALNNVPSVRHIDNKDAQRKEDNNESDNNKTISVGKVIAPLIAVILGGILLIKSKLSKKNSNLENQKSSDTFISSKKV